MSQMSSKRPFTELNLPKRGKKTFSFLWTIHEFTNVSLVPEIKSLVIIGGPQSGFPWQLTIKPKSRVGAVVERWPTYYFAVNLKQLAGKRVKADFQVNILDANGKPVSRPRFQPYGTADYVMLHLTYDNEIKEVVIEYETNTQPEPPMPDWGWDKLMKTSDVERLVVNGKLKIHCKVWIFGELKHSMDNVSIAIGGSSVKEKYKMLKNRLSMDFGRLFRESVRTDVVISTGKTSYKAHKVILEARSSVFAAMFNAAMIEKEINIVNIPDFDDEVVYGMLEHMYMEETDAMAELAPELLRIADKYNLTWLKKDCEHAIATKLNMQNAGIILVLAHSHNAPNLKSCATGFIKFHKDDLMKTKAFKDAMKANENTGAFAEINLSQ